MEENTGVPMSDRNENKISHVIYNHEKDYYKGIGGELRLKAEGLFKKAKEKGISIEDIDIITLKENSAEFPGVGEIELPAYLVQVKGRHLQSGQVMVDGKQIDYFNRYKGYVTQRIESKNFYRDEKGRLLRENNKPKIKDNIEFSLTDWEMFQIAKSLVDDKEFGLEKTITGACDRVIRKLMGENDWLSAGEARLLDEEYNSVQEGIMKEKGARKNATPFASKRASERQIGYLKARIKNLGINPDDEIVIKEVIKQSGFEETNLGNLSMEDMSKVIDSISAVVPKVKDVLEKKNYMPVFNQNKFTEAGEDVKQ